MHLISSSGLNFCVSCPPQIEDKIDGVLKKSIKENYRKSTTITDAWNVVQIQVSYHKYHHHHLHLD